MGGRVQARGGVRCSDHAWGSGSMPDPCLVLPPSGRRSTSPDIPSTPPFLISSARVGWRPEPGRSAGNSRRRSLRTRHPPHRAGALPAVSFDTSSCFPASPAFWTAKPEAGSPSGPQDLGKGWDLQAPAERHGDPTTSGSGDPRAGVTLGEDHTGFSRCPPSLVSRGAQPRSGRRPQGGYEGREQPEPSRTAGGGRVSCHVALEHGPTARSEPGSP